MTIFRQILIHLGQYWDTFAESKCGRIHDMTKLLHGLGNLESMAGQGGKYCLGNAGAEIR